LFVNNLDICYPISHAMKYQPFRYTGGDGAIDGNSLP
jgi:hypothetical protein